MAPLEGPSSHYNGLKQLLSVPLMNRRPAEYVLLRLPRSFRGSMAGSPALIGATALLTIGRRTFTSSPQQGGGSETATTAASLLGDTKNSRSLATLEFPLAPCAVDSTVGTSKSGKGIGRAGVVSPEASYLQPQFARKPVSKRYSRSWAEEDSTTDQRIRSRNKEAISSSSDAVSAASRQTKRASIGLHEAESMMSTFQKTLEKPLLKRHERASTSMLSSSHNKSQDLSRSFDPALIVQLDSRTKEIHLNPIQKALIWEARRKEYQRCLEHIVRCIQSHLTPLEKCLRLLILHEEEVIPKRLRLRADTYDDIFHTLYATATLSNPAPNADVGKRSSPHSEEDEETMLSKTGEESTFTGAHSAPAELGTRAAAALTLTSEETLHKMWEMYRYMVDSGTNPTPRIIQHLMGLLEQRARRLGLGKTASAKKFSDGTETDAANQGGEGVPVPGLALLEAKAHSLAMDLDRFGLCPTQYTLHSYIFLCQVCGVMHLAMARVTDYYSRFGHQPSSATYALLLHGFLHQQRAFCSKGQGKAEGAATALAVMTTMQSTPISTHLLNEMLQVGRYSNDPLSAFTIYKSVLSRRTREGMERPSAAAAAGLLAPSLHTFSILLEVLLLHENNIPAPSPSVKDSQCRQRFPKHLLDFTVKEMQRYGIKGNKLVLNKLLECFRRSGQEKAFKALRKSMLDKNITVFDEYRKL